jgi:hypothetical protein
VEKLILGVALVILLTSTALLLHSLTKTRSEVRELSSEARSAASGGVDIAVDAPIDTKVWEVIEDPLVMFGTLPAAAAPPLRGSLYEPPDYIICYNEACNKLIPIASDKCPFCASEQPPRSNDPGKDTDRDRDGIPNHIEQKYAFLNPDNPRDALMDQDQDGFLNVEEYLHGTDMQNAASIPPLGILLRRDRLLERPLPIMLRKISRNNSDDPSAWTLSLQVYDAAKRTTRTKLSAVGKSESGYAIRSAAFEPDPQREGKQIGTIEIVPEAGGEPYTLREGISVNERDKAVRLGFLASRDPQYQTRGGIRIFVQKAGDTITLKHGRDPSKQVEETYLIESIADDGKVEIVRTVPAPAAGEAPVRIVVPTLNLRTDFAVPSGAMSGGGMFDGGMMPGTEPGGGAPGVP